MDGVSMLDLCYEEDVAANVDMNVVLTGDGKYVELQGTGERQTFTEEELDQMINQAKKGINQLTRIQKEALEG